jgi:hypothetical protein
MQDEMGMNEIIGKARLNRSRFVFPVKRHIARGGRPGGIFIEEGQPVTFLGEQSDFEVALFRIGLDCATIPAGASSLQTAVKSPPQLLRRRKPVSAVPLSMWNVLTISRVMVPGFLKIPNWEVTFGP